MGDNGFKRRFFAALFAATALYAHDVASLQAYYKSRGMEVPANILVPDELNSSIGTLRFDDGRPTQETVKKAYRFLDTSRATEVFLDHIGAVETDTLKAAFERMGATRSNHVLIGEDLIDEHQVWPTGNAGTVYVFGFLDLKKDGATVVEIPKGIGPGFLDDAWMRWVIDFGPTGPDRGKGATYVILPPDYKGELDAPIGCKKATMTIAGERREVFVVKSPTYYNWMALRGFLVDGRPDVSVKLFKEKLKIYPLASAANPPAMKFVNMSDKNTAAVAPATADYFNVLDGIIQREPIDAIDPETRGEISAIGIEKGEAFKPDEYWRGIYDDAAKIGDAIGRSILYAPRDKEAYYYPDRRWYTGFMGGSHLWLKDDGRGGIYLDARILYFYGAIAVTPAMVLKMVGKGSQYAFCARDKHGAYLDGGKFYKVRIPAPVPAKRFWSIVAYDTQTRSMLPSDQKYPVINSTRSTLKHNKDGSVDVYFGPTPPKGMESNWIQTVPGHGFFVLLRLYGPTEAWFDKTWKPGDFEPIEEMR